MDRWCGRMEGIDGEEEVADRLVLLQGCVGINLVVIQESRNEFESVEVRMTHENVNEFCRSVDHEDAPVSVKD